MARTKAISLIQSGSTKVDLAELSGLVISNIQKDTLSQGLKSQAYTGNPASGSVEFKRFKNSASQPYGTARTAGKGDAITVPPTTVNLNTHKEIVEEAAKFDLDTFGVGNIMARRADNHVDTVASEFDTAFFAQAKAEGTSYTPASDAGIEDLLEGIIQTLESVKNDYVRGVPRNMIRLVLDPLTYGKARNYLDKSTNNANVDTAAEDFAIFHGVRVYVSTGGSLSINDAYGGNGGVRPALYLESGNLVSDSTDTDGAYILQWNQPPSDPSSISYGTPQAGNSLVLSTGGSTDPEGDAISYVWERKIDSGAYVQLGITTAKTFTDTVPTSGTTYTARVKAVDANGLESGYCTGSAKTISYNTPPVISGSDQNLGSKTAPFTYQYTVTDAQAATQTITVTEKLTNGTQTITLRTYTATSGAQNTVDLSSVWLPLLSGTHVLTITATDSTGGSATRKITFSRTVSRIAAARAFNTDALVQKVFVSLYPAPIPADATLHLEVTNNPFDTSPVWVDITDKANRLVHVFTNTTAAKGYGLGYRFYITKGTQEIEITQATIRFA